jgi:endonuclease/exonuclease/phosphatase (EEP) superfamily protein YafD
MRATGLAPLKLLSVAFLGTVAWTLAAFDPAVTWWFPSCPFYAMTGWLCPLCGSLRAVHALLVGHPIAALAFNPLTIAGLGMWLVAREGTTRFCFSRSGLALLVGFGLVRNL